jgi:CDGSH-type Zn-finger protein
MSSDTKNNHPPAKGEMRIKVSENGPYLVSGGIPLTEQTLVSDIQGFSYDWDKSKQYPLQETYELCRCGRSKTKPFCDKTHLTFNFDGTETASREPYLDQAEQRTVGPQLELTDVQTLCASARFCDRAGGVWDLTRQSDDPQAKRVAIEEAGNCPAGRLVVWDKAGKAIEPEFGPSIGLVEDPLADVHGPIWVRGGIPVEAADGTVYEIRNRLTLCRCGKSANKPFCDGGHVDV